MKVYYNDNDKKACAWLKELMKDGLIPKGDVDDRSILEVTSDDVKAYTQVHFFAGIGGWSHALFLAGWPEERPIWSGSCPCFPKGTLISTENGFKPIEEVSVGDKVLTHKRRFRRVTETFKSKSKILTLKGQGHFGLECTGNHPFWSRDKKKARTLELEKPEWSEASNMPGKRWECATIVPYMQIPKFKAKTWRGRSPNLPDMGPSFFKFLGFWVGDGWTQGDSVVLCSRHGESKLIMDLAKACGLSGSLSKERTTERLRIGSKLLAVWIRNNFGSGARNKTIPIWLLAQENKLKEAFLEGYLLADGHKSAQPSGSLTANLTTVSKSLAIGTRMLLNSLGYAVCIMKKTPKRKHVFIEGRKVEEKGFFRLSWQTKTKSRSFKFDDGAWGLVRSAKKSSRVVPIFNFEVEEDHSYVAEGIVVHNCQPFSCAGKGEGEKDKRHLWPEFKRLIKECGPPEVIGEQVASKAGRLWLSGVRSDLEEMGYAVGAADLCAAGIGSPHIRQRLFWVARDNGVAYPERHGGWPDEQRWRSERRASHGGLGQTMWLADAERQPRSPEHEQDQGERAQSEPRDDSVAGRGGQICGVADAEGGGLGADGGASGESRHAEQRQQAGGMGDADEPGREACVSVPIGAEEGSERTQEPGSPGGVADTDGERRAGERVLLREEEGGRDEGQVPKTSWSGEVGDGIEPCPDIPGRYHIITEGYGGVCVTEERLREIIREREADEDDSTVQRRQHESWDTGDDREGHEQAERGVEPGVRRGEGRVADADERRRRSGGGRRGVQGEVSQEGPDQSLQASEPSPHGGMADAERPERGTDDEHGRVHKGRQEDPSRPGSGGEDGGGAARPSGMADATSGDGQREGAQLNEHGLLSEGGDLHGSTRPPERAEEVGVADAEGPRGREERGTVGEVPREEPAQRQQRGASGSEPPGCGPTRRFKTWDDSVWHLCQDQRERRIPAEPSLFPMAYGLPGGRVGLLRGAGNAICPQVAAEFLMAYLEISEIPDIKPKPTDEVPSIFD